MEEKSWLKAFGFRLRALVKEADITQTTLATLSGLSQAAISGYINGKRMPNARAIVNLSYALNCPVDHLIDFGRPIE